MSISDLPARLAAVRDTIRTEFTRDDAEPWIVAYSGGKDSTLLLQLVWEAAAAAGSEIGYDNIVRAVQELRDL